jgi:hypothetical protein
VLPPLYVKRLFGTRLAIRPATLAAGVRSRSEQQWDY